MLWKCTVCGYTAEGDHAPEKCPKCGVDSLKFTSLSDEESKKIYDADNTNDIHVIIQSYAARIVNLCDEGIEKDLDPGCVSGFKAIKDRAWEIKQLTKAEIAGHVSKNKW